MWVNQRDNFLICSYLNMKYTRKSKKGGVRIASEDMNRNQALSFFLNNSSFSVLTNSSISCITLLVTLNDGVNSPYRILRPVGFDQQVKKILLKVFITADISDWYTIEGRGNFSGIEVTSKEDFQKEIDIQREIYRKSFFSDVSLLEGMCPHIINWHHCEQNENTVQLLRKLIGLTPIEQQSLNQILDGGSIGNNQISFIVMEFMEEYQVASDVFQDVDEEGKIRPYDEKQHILLDLLQFEFQRLNSYGYKHGDAHFGNVMIHQDYDYLYSSLKGRTLIIDYGRTEERPKPYNINIVDNNLERFRNEPWGISQNYLIDIDKFNAMYQEKLQNMQHFYQDLGGYLQDFIGYPNDRSYNSIRNVLEEIINNNPEMYFGGNNKKQSIFKTPPKIFISNLKALFNHEANGEIKGDIIKKKRSKTRIRRNNIRRYNIRRNNPNVVKLMTTRNRKRRGKHNLTLKMKK